MKNYKCEFFFYSCHANWGPLWPSFEEIKSLYLSDQFYGNLKMAIFVAILTNFGQTQVLDGFQCFYWKYSKPKTKQAIDPNLVPKLPHLNCPLDETLKTSQK